MKTELITLSRAAIVAGLKFTSKDATRTNIGCLYFDSKSKAVATDGHRLAIVDHAAPPLPPEEFEHSTDNTMHGRVIRLDTLKAAVKAAGKGGTIAAQWELSIMASSVVTLTATTKKGAAVTLTGDGGDYAETFPDYAVILDAKPHEPGATTGMGLAAFNAAYLADFGALSEAIGQDAEQRNPSPFVMIHARDGLQCAAVTNGGGTLLGVIMPIRCSEAEADIEARETAAKAAHPDRHLMAS
jgi:hypothetical protein